VNVAFPLTRLGALGLLLSAGVFWEEPLRGSLRQNPAEWFSAPILFAFPVMAGLATLVGSFRPHNEREKNHFLLFHGMALLSVLWLMLWCFVWLAVASRGGDRAEMFIKHTAYLHLFGVGFSMAGYATGWMASQPAERSARFLMPVGWAVSYVAWFNLYLEPRLKFLWAPAVGGLLVVSGAFLLSRQVKPKVEAPA